MLSYASEVIDESQVAVNDWGSELECDDTSAKDKADHMTFAPPEGQLQPSRFESGKFTSLMRLINVQPAVIQKAAHISRL